MVLKGSRSTLLNVKMHSVVDFISGYNFNIDKIRAKEFPLLEDTTYVDYAGTALYATSQIKAFQRDLFANLYGNPHSRNASSQLATDTIEQVRYRILDFFRASADEYSVIFTSSCTAALKLIAESFMFEDSHKGDNSTEESRRSQEGKTEKKVCSNKEHFDESLEERSGDVPVMSEHEDKRPGCFCYLLDNHTSVFGMRELIADRANSCVCITEAELLQSTKYSGETVKTARSSNNLFAYPAESNFSGRKYPLDWIEKIQNRQMEFQTGCHGRWFVLLDAACFVATNRLDLRRYKPDFVTLSFYKMFGFPTGLGALLVRNDSAGVLRKRYVGGGTVVVSDVTERFHVFRPNISNRFEDGSLPFLDIVALRHGLETFNHIGGDITKVSNHCFTIARYFHHNLVQLHHGNQTQMACVYCETSFEDPTEQGSIVSFNLRRANRDFIGYAEVNKLAELQNIHFRTGCFCNIGSCRKFLNMTTQQIKEQHAAGHDCGDDVDLVDGLPTGSVRISFGYSSTLCDAQKCLQFIVDYFMERCPENPNFLVDYSESGYVTPLTNSSQSDGVKSNRALKHSPPLVDTDQSNDRVQEMKESVPLVESNHLGDRTHTGELKEQLPLADSGQSTSRKKEELTLVDSVSNAVSAVTTQHPDESYLTNICLFPVKSCAPFQVSQWEIGSRGLMYDRTWMITQDSGVSLGQKREPKLCFVQPSIDINNDLLILKFPGMADHEVPLNMVDSDHDSEQRKLCTNKVCSDRVNIVDCGDSVAAWISEALQRQGCRLLRQKETDSRRSKGSDTADSSLSLANVCQFLLVSRASVRSLEKQLELSETDDIPDEDNLVDRFRGNLIINGGKAFEEESWDAVKFGNMKFLCQGQCNRCQMVCFDPVTGERTKEPLRTLASWRGGKVPFGVYLSVEPSDQLEKRLLQVGDKVKPIQLKTV